MVAVGIIALSLLVVTAITLAFRQVSRRAATFAAVVLGVALVAEWVIAATGLLHNWNSAPPPLVPIVFGAVLLGTAVALSPLGRQLIAVVPLAWLIGFQAFRLPLELVMHQAAVDGLMPVQMSYSGANFDIVTGVSALFVSALAGIGRAPRWLVVGWNVMGSLLLVTIMTIAIMSTPTFGAFGPDRMNTWIADPPYVWLPGVLVPAAWFGHALLWRRLLTAPRSADSR